MATTAYDALNTGTQRLGDAIKARQAQPKPAAAPAAKPDAGAAAARMGSFETFFRSEAQAEAKAGAEAQAAAGKLEGELDQEDAERQQQLKGYQDQLGHVWQAMQRQRMVTIDKAKILKFVLPVLGTFALMAGIKGGSDDALAALGGGLAGLSKGMNDAFQRNWKAYSQNMKDLLQQAKDTEDEIKGIYADDSRSLTEKIDLLKVASANTPMLRMAAAMNDLAKYDLEFKKFQFAREKAAALHDKADKALRDPTGAETDLAANALFPDGVAPMPDTSKLAILAPLAPNQEALQGLSPKQQLAAIAQQVPAATRQKALQDATKRKFGMVAFQVAQIAKQYAARHNLGFPDALRKTRAFLETRNYLPELESGTLSEADVEQGLDSGAIAEPSQPAAKTGGQYTTPQGVVVTQEQLEAFAKSEHLTPQQVIEAKGLKPVAL